MDAPFEIETIKVTSNADDMNMKQQENQHPLGDESKNEKPTSERDSAAEDLKNVDANNQKSESTKPNNYETFSMKLGYYITPVLVNAEDLNMKQQENELIMSELEQEAPTTDEVPAEKVVEVLAKNCQETKTYEKLPTEMRHHILTFTDLEAIRNIGQCSKICYKDFLKFQLPHRIELQDVDGGIEVTEIYKKPDGVKSEVFKKMKNVHDHLTGIYKYFEEAPNDIVINMKKWPSAIVNMSPVISTKNWHVTARNSMYADFIEFARTKKYIERIVDSRSWEIPLNLHLKECDEIEERIVAGPEFFKCGILDVLENLEVSTKSQIDHDDLLVCYGLEELKLANCTDLEVIRQRVERADGDNCNWITIDLSPEDDMTFIMAELFPGGRFHVRYIKLCGEFQIGNHVRGIILRNGKCLKLVFCYSRISPYSSYFDEKNDDEYSAKVLRTDDEETESSDDDDDEESADDPVSGENKKPDENGDGNKADSEYEEKDAKENENSDDNITNHFDDEKNDDGNYADDEEGEHFDY